MRKTTVKIVILVAVVAAAAAAVVIKNNRSRAASASVETTTVGDTNQASPPGSASRLPKLVDLGAGKCIPCKMMAPILEELKKEYAGRMNVEFIDVWKDPDAGKAFGIEVIPTQIFYDADGKELFRHVGFFSKEDILARWKELGVNVSDKPESGTAPNSAEHSGTNQPKSQPTQ